MNILILSAGTRNKVVQYYRQALAGRGRVIATDCSPYAPAIYEADAYEIVPRMTEPGYLDVILSLVRKWEAAGCFSLIDPELSLLARERERFEALGCTPMISPYNLVETCFHKYRMAGLFAECGLPTAKCYLSLEEFDAALERGEISYPVFAKPEDGSASLNISQVYDRKELSVLFERHENLMIQEFMDGQEYGADVYVDMVSGQCTAIFLKKKLRMRAGETDKSVSVHDPALFETIRRFVERAGFRGQIDIDIFDVGGTYYFSEVNPRYGGGYPHAYCCGVDTPSMYVRNLSGEACEPEIGAYEDGVCMMKYNELSVRRIADGVNEAYSV
ncbi:MAG: ATP-grasp domain-containing protein [Eubacteriales bacterium]|nr:ATP-grasp domain-containing protein [Eubacteriales bacterium]